MSMMQNLVVRLTADILSEMHPQRNRAPDLSESPAPQARIQQSVMEKHLRRATGNSNGSIGFFGWADHFLKPICGTKKKHPFISQLARLARIIASGEVPNAVAFLLTCGSLTALHKETPQEQMITRQHQRNPKLRPINSGSILLKASNRAILNTSGVKSSIKRLGPEQLGCGVKAGPEIMAMSMRAAYKAGSPICTDRRRR